MNNVKRIKKISSVLSSDKFKNDLSKNRELLKDLHTYNILRDDFVWFLVAYPLTEKKEKIFKKLDGKKKFGMLSRHLVSVSRKLGISQIFLQNFYELKERERYALKSLKDEDWKYYSNFFDEEKTKREPETINQKIDVVERKATMEGKWNTLSSMLVKQTMDLMDFCLDRYDAREDKINQILGDE